MSQATVENLNFPTKRQNAYKSVNSECFLETTGSTISMSQCDFPLVGKPG